MNVCHLDGHMFLILEVSRFCLIFAYIYMDISHYFIQILLVLDTQQ